MNKSIKSSTLAAASLALLVATSQATVIFTDTFEDGTGDWYRYGNDGTLTTTDDQLSWTRNNTGPRETIGRSFTSQTIGVGESIRFSFDFTQSGTTSVGILRAGLYHVATPIEEDNWAGGNNIGAWSGYYTFIRDDSTSANSARQHSGASTSNTVGPGEAGTTLTGSDTGRFDILNNTTYQGVFEVFRTSETEMTTLFTLSSGSTTHMSVEGITSTVQSDFNTVILRHANGTSLFDNIEVSVIPEPSAALLGSLGLLALLRRRR